MNQEDGGYPHLRIGDLPKDDARVEEVHVLVAIHPGGGEGIYGHVIGDNMFNFVTQDRALKEMLERYIREHGTVEVCRRQGVKLEWRAFKQVGDGTEIT